MYIYVCVYIYMSIYPMYTLLYSHLYAHVCGVSSTGGAIFLARHLAGLMGFGAPGGLGLEFFFLHEETPGSHEFLVHQMVSSGMIQVGRYQVGTLIGG